MTNGYMGKILWVDLSKESFEDESLPEEIYRQFIGGYGLAAKIIYDNMPVKVDMVGLLPLPVSSVTTISHWRGREQCRQSKVPSGEISLPAWNMN